MRSAALVSLVALLALGIGRCGRSAESLGTGTPDLAPSWAEKEGFAGNERAVEGARIFAQVGCLSCHTYLGAGSRNLGAPDLTKIGATGRTGAAFASYLSDPSKYGNDVMPKFKDLGRRNLLLLGAFLSASRGPR
jgi:mono/diheme cytochrome c family protein